MSNYFPHNFAVARLHQMKATPRMWAWSEEAFLLQVALLLEFAGLDKKDLQKWLLKATNVNNLTHEITDEHAVEICNSALEIVP